MQSDALQYRFKASNHFVLLQQNMQKPLGIQIPSAVFWRFKVYVVNELKNRSVAFIID